MYSIIDDNLLIWGPAKDQFARVIIPFSQLSGVINEEGYIFSSAVANLSEVKWCCMRHLYFLAGFIHEHQPEIYFDWFEQFKQFQNIEIEKVCLSEYTGSKESQMIQKRFLNDNGWYNDYRLFKERKHPKEVIDLQVSQKLKDVGIKERI